MKKNSKKIILVLAVGLFFGTVGALVGEEAANNILGILLLTLGFLITVSTYLLSCNRE